MFAVCTLALALSAPLLAHEDDPKLLDRVAPYEGPAFRRDLAPAGGRGDQASLGFGANNVTLLSWLPLNQLDGAASGNDIWGYVSPAGREYALIGTHDGTVIVEVTNPGDAQVVASIPGPGSLWRDIKTYRDHAFAVSEGGRGIQVIDLTQIDAGSATLVQELDDAGVAATHNVAIDEVSGFLYRAGGGSSGIRIYDLADPANPTYVASWSARYVHDLQVVTHTTGPQAGRQIAYLCGGLNGGFTKTRLEVLDVTVKSAIQRLSDARYPNRAYAHQGWLDPGRGLFFLGDELDEDGSLPTTTHVLDVSEPHFARSVTSFTNGNGAIGHNLFTKDNLIYAANYTSGLRVFDASDPYTPDEIAYFDTWPANDADTFNGLWGVYPYLPSGIVLGSDLERGLFVWSVAPPSVQIVLPTGRGRVIDVTGEAIPIDILEAVPGTIAAGSQRLFVDVGNGFVETALRPLGGSRYAADLPSLPCTKSLGWYVQASSVGGTTWTSPVGAPAEHYVSIAGADMRSRSLNRMESDQTAWTVDLGADDATGGAWVRVEPVGGVAQPGSNHPPGGSACWITGQASPGSAANDHDVDGGRTTLVSTVMDLSENTDPLFTFWYWYSNDQGGEIGADVLQIDVSPDNGGNWIPIDQIGPTGPDTHGGWRFRTIRLNEFMAGTDETRVRFVASDLGLPSIVEAAIDDFTVAEALCSDCNRNGVSDDIDLTSTVSIDLNANGRPDECDCPVEIYCLGLPNSVFPTGATIAAIGRTNMSLEEFYLDVYDAAPQEICFFFYGGSRTEVPFGDGLRCVGPGAAGLYMSGFERTDIFGSVRLARPFENPVMGTGTAQVRPGTTWNFQVWYRDLDVPGGAGYNTSDAVSVTFCP